MLLKSLELHGFKSFADATRLEFHEGVTGIVGPNGCGKSNVVDAIRWVLGETSARSLRGTEMADVIFSGTTSRRSLGMAEVLLTLGDCESTLRTSFNEVCIGRRLFRDGKSEYLLNRQPCRLKDIQDLFYDTGVGRSAYSVMEQGKIDQLLSARPEDRRTVFEEAAGISKAKHQRRDALRKLEQTEANLLRISDLLAEQERHVTSLRRQATKARRHAELLHQVTLIDTHLAHREDSGLAAEERGLRATLGTIATERERLQALLRDLQEQDLALREEAHDLDQSFQHLGGEARDAEHEARAARERIRSNEERALELRSLMGRNDAEAAESVERLAAETEAFHGLGTELEAVQGRVAASREARDAAVRGLEDIRIRRADAERSLQSHRSRLAESRQGVATLGARLEATDAQGTAARELVARLEADGSLHDGHLNEREREAARLASLLEDARQERERLSEVGRNLAAEHHGLHVRREELRTRRDQEERSFAARETRLETLRHLLRSGEGLARGTREVLAGLGNPDRYLPALRGILAAQVRVAPEHQSAVEACLGPALQAIITADPGTIHEVVLHLRDHHLGQAGFLLLEAARTTSEPMEPTLPQGSLAWARDLVDADPPFRDLVDRLLARSALVPDLGTALGLASRHPHLAFVTPTGEFVSPGGLITGGTGDDPGASLLGRHHELDTLEQDLLRDRKALDRLVAQLLEAEEAETRALAALTAHREASQVQEGSAARLAAEQSLVSRDTAQLAERIRLLQREQSTAAERATHLAETQDRLTREHEEALRELERLRDELPALEATGEALREDEIRLSDEASAARTRLALEEQSAATLEARHRDHATRIAELERLLARRQTDNDACRETLSSMASENEALATRADRAEALSTTLRADLAELGTRRDSLRAAREEGESRVSSTRGEADALQEQHGRTEIRLTQLDLHRGNHRERIQRLYRIDLDSFQPDPDEVRSLVGQPAGAEGATALDWDAANALLGDLTRKLQALGSVNSEAIAELEEREESFGETTRQHADLVAAREELLRVIQRIDATSRSLFSETFEQVRLHFRSTFTELFGPGAEADLVLLDADDPLECGIDIIARPPGKKLQCISLLSGGERSMTAVALLFAVYMVRPSPFCVLDELDAPLDEANIARFVRMLDRFQERSQFIIVTHSKRTMSRCDILYGISMEEPGVSKTLGVRFGAVER